MRELEVLTAESAEESLHIATRPAMSFQGNIPLAVKECRDLVERGYRVALFAPTLGELERLADILREYSVPFQLGLEPNDAASSLSRRARLSRPARVASTYLVKGRVRRGVVFPGFAPSPSSAPKICSIPPT